MHNKKILFSKTITRQRHAETLGEASMHCAKRERNETAVEKVNCFLFPYSFYLQAYIQVSSAAKWNYIIVFHFLSCQ
jgi:hypothetical protein